MGLWARTIVGLILAAGGLAAAGTPGREPINLAATSVKLDPSTIKRGAEVYGSVCSACHDQGVGRAPQRTMLSLMTPESIDLALTKGVMRPQAAALTMQDRAAVAQYLAGQPMGAHPTPPLMCKGPRRLFDLGEPPPFAGWGLTSQNTHAISTKVAGIDRAAVGRLRLKWALGFPNAIRARSQPAMAGGAIFVGSHDGTVFALDRATGCARWTFRASAEVRTAIVVSPWRAGDAAAEPRLYFGDLIGDIYALRMRTGALDWKRKPDEHPNATITAAPVLYGDRLYVAVSSLEEARAADPRYACCTFRGSVEAMDAATGAPVWRTFMTDPPTKQGVNAKGVQRWGPSGVALWNSPAIDPARHRLYIATGDNYSSPPTALSDAIVSLDLATGKIAWAYQATGADAWNVACGTSDTSNCPEDNGPDYDFGAGAVLARASDGRDYVLAGQKSGMLYAVDADSGKLVWKTKVGRGGVKAGIHFGIAVIGDTAYVPVADVPDGRVYAEPARPGLYAVDIRTGRYLWKAPAPDVCGDLPLCHPGYAAAITATPEVVLAGSDDGHFRAYDAKSGAVLWDYDTVRAFKTVNGTIAHGGAMGGGAGPVAFKGFVVTNSGYGFAGAMPGDALLVFSGN
jgi:polyvinyl alcohol dehydrogenase (cytochrome)